MFFFFFSSRRRHTRFDCDWSSDVCSSDLGTVIWQDPPPGVSAPAGLRVTLVSSDGPPKIPVPDVTGLDGGLSQRLVAAAGLAAAPVGSVQAASPPGITMLTRPPPGTLLLPRASGTVLV